MPRTLLTILLLCAVVFAGPVEAATAVARFAQRTAEVGVPLQFEIVVDGTTNYTEAPEVRVDGLEFEYQGPQTRQQFSFENGSMRRAVSVTHVYHVTPQRAGSFNIPALEVDAGGQRLKTAPVALKVQPGGTGETQQGSAARVEIVPAKTSAYVGEQVPVQVRLLFDQEIRGGPVELPVLQGDAFTKLKMQQAGRTEIEKDDRAYNADIFETVVTPIHAGKLALGPIQTTVQVVLPRQRFQGGGRGRTLLDDWDRFFDDPLFSTGRPERRKITAPVVEMSVKPLPTTGRPKNFSNAVGQFALALERTPTRAKINDPLTLKFVVTGKGNFERLPAPSLTDPKGWRIYPPTENFAPGDDRISGTKTFEVALIPETKHTQLPVFELNYFDPVAERYVSLKSPAAPLVVEGEPAPPPPPVAAAHRGAAESTPRTAAATPAPVAAPTDILGIQYEPGKTASVRPLYREPGFWAAQGVPGFLLLGLLAKRFRRADHTRRETAALRRERAKLLARLRGEEDRHAFYDTAARLLQVEAALRTGRVPETIDAALVHRVVPQGEKSEILTEIFDTRAEAVYAGTASGGERISPLERDRVLGAVATMERALA